MKIKANDLAFSHRSGLTKGGPDVILLPKVTDELGDARPMLASMQNDIAEILIAEDEIKEKVKDIGAAIARDYAGLYPVIVGVLKGSALLMADLLRCIDIPVLVDFIAVSSYGPAVRSSGVVRFLKDLDFAIGGRHVLVVEDIVDTGLTLNYILRVLGGRRPVSLEVATLLDKPARRLIDIKLKYKGFELPDKFVVGYGLDYAQRYRNLPFVCVLKPDVYNRE